VSASASSVGPMVVDLLADSPLPSPSPSPTLDPSHSSVSESVSAEVPAAAHTLVLNTGNGTARPGAAASTCTKRHLPRTSGRRKP
jgi:hypothetical protein